MKSRAYYGKHLRLILNNQGASIQWWSKEWKYLGLTLYFKPRLKLTRIGWWSRDWNKTVL
jgi:hypothetical protein